MIDLHGFQVRRNLTLFEKASSTIDNVKPIHQRFGPRKHYQHTEMLNMINEGRKRFNEMLQAARVHKTHQSRYVTDGNGHYHHGIWYGRGSTFCVPSSDTKQDKKPIGQVKVLFHTLASKVC